MSYLVLARKYRPQTFEDLVGQEHVTRTLANAIRMGRIAHGYLFTGTRGVGKTTAARIFAKALNCEAEKNPTPTPCGKCASCREIAASTSNDVFEIDAASNTGVDDVRELRENVKYLPSRSRYKVYIIDEAHMLTKNAFNALLKTLEEPPPHVVFILATTEPHKIPDTVLSRTQHYDFKMVGLGAISQYLEKLMAAEKAKVGRDVLMLVARKAAGSVRDALSYMDQVLSFGPEQPLGEIAEVLGVVDRQALLDISTAVLARDPVAVMDILERLGSSNWDVKDLLADLLEHFRNLVAAKVAKNPAALIDAGDAELAALAEQVKDVPLETLEHLFLLLAEAEELILRSGQPRLVLEMTLIRLAQASRIIPLDNLLDQLIALKTNPPNSFSPAGGGGAANRSQTAAASDAAPAEKAKPDPILDPQGAFVEALRGHRASLAAMFGQAELLRDEDEVVLKLPRGFTFKQFEREADLLQSVAHELFGARVKVRLEPLEIEPDQTPRAKIEARKKAEQARQDFQRDTMSHPAVKWVLELFPEAEVNVRPPAPVESE